MVDFVLMARKDFSQLPTTAELERIRAAEAVRQIALGKEREHFADFSTLLNLAEHFFVDTREFARSYTEATVYEQDLFAIGAMLTEQLKQHLLGAQPSAGLSDMCNAAYDYLAEEDTEGESDLIFVFGAKTPLRIEKTVELYKKGLGNRILVSGSGPHYAEDGKEPEARAYARYAVEHGVPAEVLIIEDQSITVPDNVRASLNLLDERGIVCHSITLVNSPYTQRRGWAHFKKYVPDNIVLRRVNCATGEHYQRDAWYRNPAGIDVVLSEFVKLKVAVSLNTA